jgi:hypothetical protein
MIPKTLIKVTPAFVVDIGPKDLFALDTQELGYRFVGRQFSAQLKFAAFCSVFARSHGRKLANDLR